MVTALVLLVVERGRTNEIAETIAGIDGVTEVYSVAIRPENQWIKVVRSDICVMAGVDAVQHIGKG